MVSARPAARVRKRDGHEQSFDALRLVASLEAALRAAGEDPAFARQFAELVPMRALGSAGVVGTPELARAAVGVLRRFDCGEAAVRYRARRTAEEQACAALRVHVPAAAGSSRSAPFDRARLQHALQRDRYLERNVARELARRVERRLTAMGQRHVTGRLLTALADNECRVLGLASGSVGSERIGPERRMLRAWLGGACVPAPGAETSPALAAPQADVRPALGEQLLASFAAEEVLPPATVQAMDCGDFALLGGGDWLRPLLQRLHPDPGESATAFWERVAEAAAGARETQVLLPQGYLDPATTAVPKWLAAAGVQLRPSTHDLELAAAWAELGIWHAVPVGSWAGGEEDRQAELAARGRTSISWSAPGRAPAPAELRHGLVQGGAVLNLARLAGAAGPWAEREFLAAVAEVLQQACSGLQALARRAGAATAPRVVLLPAGLDHAVGILYPDAALRHGQERRLRLSLREACARACRKSGLRLDGGRPPHADAAGTRLADRDGVPGPPSYAVGWASRPESAALQVALDASPWLEFPAAELHAAGWSAPLLKRAASTSS